MRPLTEIIVHCTATKPNFMPAASSIERVAEIKRWHVTPKPDGRGWSDIGYHYLIDRDGTILKGRPLERIGAHVLGHNKGTIGISLFGGHGSSATDAFEDNFTYQQNRALRTLLMQLMQDHSITKLSGHSDYANKACPGFNVKRWWKSQPPQRKTLIESKTVQAVGGTGAAGAVGLITAISQLDSTAQYIILGAAAVAVVCLAVIYFERMKKWRRGDR